jgi:hypothetical protein
MAIVLKSARGGGLILMALRMEQYLRPRRANTYGPAGLILLALGGLIIMALVG